MNAQTSLQTLSLLAEENVTYSCDDFPDFRTVRCRCLNTLDCSSYSDLRGVIRSLSEM